MTNKNQQLAVMTPEIREAFPPEVLEVIRTSLCPTASDAEFLLFAHKAASYKLDPFKNEIFFIKYGNQARIQFAAEAYLAKAREKEGFQPPDTQMVCENDEFRIARNPETKEMEVVQHETGFPRGKIIGAYSIAYRDGYRPVTVIMDRSEIEHMFTGQNKDNWIKWTTDMFGKHVEQRGLKKQYGLEFGDDDTLQANGAPDPYERKDITEEVNAANEQKPPASTREQPLKAQESLAEQKDPEIEAAWKRVGDGLKQLGIVGKKEQAAYLKENMRTKGDSATVQEINELLKIINMEIDEQAAGGNDDLQ